MTTAPTLARTGLRAHTNSGTLLPCGADALTSSSSSSSSSSSTSSSSSSSSSLSSSSPSSSSSSSSPPSSSSSSSSSSSVFRFFSAQGRSTRRVTYWRTRAAAYRAALVRPASTSAVGAAAAAGWHGHWPCGGRRGRRAGGDYALSSSSSSALRLLTGHAAVSDVNAACAREKREAWGWGLAHALELLRHGAVLCRRQVRAGAAPVVLGRLTKTHTNSDPKLSGISPDFRKFPNSIWKNLSLLHTVLNIWYKNMLVLRKCRNPFGQGPHASRSARTFLRKRTRSRKGRVTCGKWLAKV